MQKILEVNHLSVHLRIEGKIYPVVNDLSFSLEKGKTLAIVGESGCGKSMSALAIMGILPEPPALPPIGEVSFKGRHLLHLPEKQMRSLRGRELAMIFQDPMSALNPVYSIGEQLIETVQAHIPLDKEAATEKALSALRDVHLSHPETLLNSYPHQLSGGMLQRVMIAMSLICDPDLLIADEPTTALDLTIQAQILDLLHEIQEKRGMTILLITHDMGVVAEMADEVCVMYAGEDIEQADVQSIFRNPSHPYTQALFSARPDIHLSQCGKRLPMIDGYVPRIHEMPKGCRFHPRCRYALSICKTNKVPQFTLQPPEHTARCWLYDKELQWKLDDVDCQEP